jgi:hypothetical protein
MTTPDRDDLLWRLGLHADPGETGGEVPDDALLAAYRRGELDPDAERRVEGVLAASAAARRRLAKLAGHPPAEPPAEVRERFLEAFAAATGEATTAGARPRWSDRRRGRSSGRWLGLAAAALLAVAAGLAVHRQLAPPALPAALSYEVTATGLSRVRGEESVPRPVEALPDTVLRIAASPVSGAVEGVEVALYRRRGDTLERLDPGPRLRLTAERGAARFEARAADLVGERPGAHDLYVVVARSGEPAPEYRIGEREPLQLLAREGSRLAYRLTVVLRAHPVPSPPDTPEVP